MKAVIVMHRTHKGPGIFAQILADEGIIFDELDFERGAVWPDLDQYDAMIVMGGPMSANDTTPQMTTEVDKVREWLKTGKPYLGVCLGLQIMVKAAGGGIRLNEVKEVGYRGGDGELIRISLNEKGKLDPLLKNLPEQFTVFHQHQDTIVPNESVTILGTGQECLNQIAKVGTAQYGIQFHPELTEKMFQQWRTQDTWLRELNQEQLSLDFAAERAKQARLGSVIMRNFIEIMRKK